MTYLALDIGQRRIGVAVGSTQVRLATPLTVVIRRTPELDAASIRALVAQYDAERVVVGLPRELDGSIGAQARTVSEYAVALQPLVGLAFDYQDERYSTAEALLRQHSMGVSERRGRSTIDASAAAIILQDFFDATES